MKLISLFLFGSMILLSFSGCKTKTPNSPVSEDDVYLGYKKIYLTADIKTFRLEDIVSEVEFIPLETNGKSIIQRSQKLLFRDQHIYIRDANESIVIFDQNGSFKNRISKIGKGPGEYNRIRNFSVDLNEKVYIYDDLSRKVFCYLKDNRFIKDYSFNFSAMHSHILDAEKGKLIFITNYNCVYDPKVENFNAIITINNDIHERILPFTTNEDMSNKMYKRQWLNLSDPYSVYQFNKKIQIHYPFGDTIYTIRNDSALPKYVLNFDSSHYKPLEVLSNITDRQELNNLIQKSNRGPYGFLEAEKYCYFRVHYLGEYLGCLYDKQSDQTIFFQTEGYSDILPFKYNPLYFYNDKLVFLIDPIDIQDFIVQQTSEDPGFIEQAEKKYPGYKKLIKSLKEDDNPVVFKAKVIIPNYEE